jgi:hypothetical protein
MVNAGGNRAESAEHCQNEQPGIITGYKLAIAATTLFVTWFGFVMTN